MERELSIAVAKAFNKEVLKGQLNPDGSTVAELAKRIESAMRSNRHFWDGFNKEEIIAAWTEKAETLSKRILRLESALKENGIEIPPA